MKKNKQNYHAKSHCKYMMKLHIFFVTNVFCRRARKVYSKIKAKYNAKKLWFFICIRFPKKKRYNILQRYLRIYNYKRTKKESLSKFVSNEIAKVSDESGIPQHILRDIADRIVE